MLFVVSTMRKAGPTQQLLQLCRLLPGFGWHPRLLTLSPEPSDTMAEKFRDAGIEHRSLHLSRFEGMLLLKSRIRAVLAELEPDLIHSQGIRSDIVVHALRGRTPHVLTVRNSAWHDYPSMFGPVRGRIMAWQHSRLIRKAECPVACSGSLARALAPIRPGMLAIANGIDTAFYSPASDADTAELRARLRLRAERRILVHVGSLIPRKRPDVLLHSFATSSLGNASDLVFVGDGPMRGNLESAARKHANVVFTGAVTNVVDYLRCADVLVSASAAEGLPNSVLEALACGVPVVLSDIAPHVEIGAHEIGAGSIVDPTSAEQLQAAVLKLFSRDRVELAAKARSLAQDRFSSRATAGAYAALYERLVAGER